MALDFTLIKGIFTSVCPKLMKLYPSEAIRLPYFTKAKATGTVIINCQYVIVVQVDYTSTDQRHKVDTVPFSHQGSISINRIFQ